MEFVLENYLDIFWWLMIIFMFKVKITTKIYHIKISNLICSFSVSNYTGEYKKVRQTPVNSRGRLNISMIAPYCFDLKLPLVADQDPTMSGTSRGGSILPIVDSRRPDI
ncbi:hypothetical protein JCM14036_03490 [Desulfotomaculum defluvii]